MGGLLGLAAGAAAGADGVSAVPVTHQGQDCCHPRYAAAAAAATAAA
jgi:hypothetical protein